MRAVGKHNESSPVKNVTLAATVVFLAGASPVLADPTLMLGGTFTFGAMQDPNFGLTARLLENDRANESTLGAGVTYYLFSGDIGVDVFAGYLFDGAAFGFGRQLNRNSSHRKAMFRNMTASLVKHELIKTTLPKAKELRGYAEPIITLAKEDSVANRRLAFNRLRDKEVVGKLFSEIGPRYQDRPGGYLRILKCGFRTGDKAPMAYVELVDRPVVEIDDEMELAEE